LLQKVNILKSWFENRTETFIKKVATIKICIEDGPIVAQRTWSGCPPSGDPLKGDAHYQLRCDWGEEQARKVARVLEIISRVGVHG